MPGRRMVIVADGIPGGCEAAGARVVERPGVMRHAEACYENAVECDREKGLNLPGVLG